MVKYLNKNHNKLMLFCNSTHSVMERKTIYSILIRKASIITIVLPRVKKKSFINVLLQVSHHIFNSDLAISKQRGIEFFTQQTLGWFDIYFVLQIKHSSILLCLHESSCNTVRNPSYNRKCNTKQYTRNSYNMVC